MFTIEYAVKKDIPSMMNIIEESLPLIPDLDWFVGDTAEFYERHISDCGFTLKAICCSTGTLAAYFTVRYPKLENDNLGYDLDFTDADLLTTAHMETCVVHPDYRGHHLEARLMKQAVEILKNTDYHYLLGTVHPDNVPSLKAFLSNDFHVAKTAKKYGGKLRHIMYRKI
ncbi:MAG: GNAT family N-acetyltransferase [Lachnospiraceae bacterium]|nr:GNAT family N-acetyltransferase [Lachnospiraceae bacterium]